jgi:ABC-type sugar transport system ATPase subunit
VKPTERHGPVAPPLLEARGLRKSYGHVEALVGIDLSVDHGETVALVGDNGAGKSTLIKIITGALRPDGGSVSVRGAAVSLRNPRDAQSVGVAVVYQDLALAENLSVAENVFLGVTPTRYCRVDRRRMARETEVVLSELAINVPSVRTRVSELSGGQRQMVAIARAVHRGGQLMVMDEPTAALGVQEGRKVLGLIEELQRRGLSILVVSHNLDHVFAVADRIAVLRRGHLAGFRRKSETHHEEIVRLIVGGEMTPV